MNVEAGCLARIIVEDPGSFAHGGEERLVWGRAGVDAVERSASGADGPRREEGEAVHDVGGGVREVAHGHGVPRTLGPPTSERGITERRGRRGGGGGSGGRPRKGSAPQEAPEDPAPCPHPPAAHRFPHPPEQPSRSPCALQYGHRVVGAVRDGADWLAGPEGGAEQISAGGASPRGKDARPARLQVGSTRVRRTARRRCIASGACGRSIVCVGLQEEQVVCGFARGAGCVWVCKRSRGAACVWVCKRSRLCVGLQEEHRVCGFARGAACVWVCKRSRLCVGLQEEQVVCGFARGAARVWVCKRSSVCVGLQEEQVVCGFARGAGCVWVCKRSRLCVGLQEEQRVWRGVGAARRRCPASGGRTLDPDIGRQPCIPRPDSCMAVPHGAPAAAAGGLVLFVGILWAEARAPTLCEGGKVIGRVEA
eukprot:scaffold8247_cov116-Isochrysis_galbana.AAC.9